MQPFPYPLIKCALIPDAQEKLHDRIHRRFDLMMQQGFLDEVRRLFERGDLHPALSSIRCVGYRQLWQHLAGQVSLDQALENAQTATRQLAKRQMTWIRSDRKLTAFSGGAADIADRIASLCENIW